MSDPDECALCQGTGIGQHGDPDTSRCSACGGRGYHKPVDDEFEPPDDYPEDVPEGYDGTGKENW